MKVVEAKQQQNRHSIIIHCDVSALMMRPMIDGKCLPHDVLIGHGKGDGTYGVQIMGLNDVANTREITDGYVRGEYGLFTYDCAKLDAKPVVKIWGLTLFYKHPDLRDRALTVGAEHWEIIK